MSIRGCNNFVFYSDQILGKSIHSVSYFGRNKRTGEDCVVKLYKGTSINFIQNSTTEIKNLMQLTNNNIVKFLSEIDYESRTKEILIVFEYCSEKSLKDMLEKPEYMYGLEIKAFSSLITHMVQAIDHLQSKESLATYHLCFSPINVLCHQTNSQDYIFKFTNFFFKPLIDESLKITDPYAVTIISVLQNNVQLLPWSFGSMIFHASTGVLPFQGENKNHVTHSIKDKTSSNICHICDKHTKTYLYLPELPYTNTLIPGAIKNQVLDILCHTIGDLHSQYEWRDISKIVTNMAELIYLKIVNASTGELHEMSFTKDANDIDLQTSIEKIFQIKPHFQLIISPINYSTNLSSKIVTPKKKEPTELLKNSKYILRQLFRLFEQPYLKPLIFWCINCEKKNLIELEIPAEIPDQPMPAHQTDDKVPNLIEDLSWARQVGASIHILRSQLLRLVTLQNALFEVRKFLVYTFLRKIDRAKRELELLNFVDAKCFDSASRLQIISELLNATSIYKEFVSKTERSPKFCDAYNCIPFFNNMFSKSKSIIEKFAKEAAVMRTLNAAASMDTDSGVTPTKMTYNEEQMHRYEKYKLRENLELTLKRSDNCRSRTSKEYLITHKLCAAITNSKIYQMCEDISNFFLKSTSNSGATITSIDSGFESSQIVSMSSNNIEKKPTATMATTAMNQLIVQPDEIFDTCMKNTHFLLSIGVQLRTNNLEIEQTNLILEKI